MIPDICDKINSDRNRYWKYGIGAQISSCVCMQWDSLISISMRFCHQIDMFKGWKPPERHVRSIEKIEPQISRLRDFAWSKDKKFYGLFTSSFIRVQWSTQAKKINKKRSAPLTNFAPFLSYLTTPYIYITHTHTHTHIYIYIYMHTCIYVYMRK